MKPLRVNTSKQALEPLRQGRIIAFPTGTAYGLAVDALQGFALQRLRNLKNRSTEKSFTVFLKEALWEEFFDLTPEEKKLLQTNQNQPLTLLVRPHVALEHLAQDGRVGLRIVDHPLMQSLADEFSGPLTATSANESGEPPCYSPDEIEKAFPYLIDDHNTYNLSLAAIINAGPLPPNLPTAIARLDGDKITIVRPGKITAAKLQS